MKKWIVIAGLIVLSACSHKEPAKTAAAKPATPMLDTPPLYGDLDRSVSGANLYVTCTQVGVKGSATAMTFSTINDSTIEKLRFDGSLGADAPEYSEGPHLAVAGGDESQINIGSLEYQVRDKVKLILPKKLDSKDFVKAKFKGNKFQNALLVVNDRKIPLHCLSK
jgi:hypothetical protein